MSTRTNGKHAGMILVSGILALPGIIAAQQAKPSASQERLLEPIAKSSYPDAFVVYQTVPRWSSGHLIRWTEGSASDTTENVFVFDRKGKLVGKARIWPPDASSVHIVNAVAGLDGRIAAVGWAVDASGTFAYFLADVSPTTGHIRVVHTTPFHGRDVAFGSDGTLWLVGYQVVPGDKSSAAPDHDIVQHYGADGTLKDSHVLRSSLQCERFPMGFAVAEPAILASRDRIGVFLRACNKWIELDPAGELVGQWIWPKMESVRRMSNVAFTPSGEVYTTVSSSAGIWLGHLDKKTSTWAIVNADLPLAKANGAKSVWLMGSDGDKLVYHVGESDLLWSKSSSSPE